MGTKGRSPCGSGRCLGHSFHPYCWQAVSTHGCKHCEVICLVPERGTISSPLTLQCLHGPEVSHLYTVTTYPWVGLHLSWGRFQRMNACSFCKWLQGGLLTLEVEPGQWRGCAEAGMRCPSLGVHSPWLPNLPHGCSCCLQMSKERKPALVLTKAELFFLVERYILVLYEESQTTLRLVGKWTKAIKRKAHSKCSLLHLCTDRDWKVGNVDPVQLVQCGAGIQGPSSLLSTQWLLPLCLSSFLYKPFTSEGGSEWILRNY